MKLNELKQSMLYTACAYKREAVDMERFRVVNNEAQTKPEMDAMSFYLAVQIMGIIESQYGVDTELPTEVAELAQIQHNIMEQVFFRMFTYIMLISVGESRHGSLGSYENKINNKFGEDMYQFAKSIKGNGRASSRKLYLSSKRDMLRFSEYCEWAFIECFGGGSFGGKPWKNIANKVTAVLNGEISPYTMVDVSWALVHNTGSIFNKNTIYYKDQGDSLQLILDIQRGGGIASHILNSTYAGILSEGVAAHMVESTKVADEVLGGALSVVVDPITIKNAGALNYKFKNLSDEYTGVISTKGVKWVLGNSIQVGITHFNTVKRSK